MTKYKIIDLKIINELGMYVAYVKASSKLKAIITAKGKTPEEALEKINLLLNPKSEKANEK